MVKFIFSFFWLFLFYACQTQTYTKAELAAYDEIAYQYTSGLFKQFNACEDSFDQIEVWQPKGTDTFIELGAGVITCIPCLHIVKPILINKKWLESDEFYKLFPRSALAAQVVVMTVKLAIYMVISNRLIAFEMRDLIKSAHTDSLGGALKVLENIPDTYPAKKEFVMKIETLLAAIKNPEYMETINLKIPIPTEFQPYYNTQVIDRKWVLDVFEQSGAYRDWLEEAKPFFDEIANVLPDEKYVQFFYRLYNSPQIDSNFTVYQFYNALHSDRQTVTN